MERYKVVDDKSRTVLLETDSDSEINAWDFAYGQIKLHPEYDIFIDVTCDDGTSHWVDSESIVSDCENKEMLNE